jgi:hypothetical protein
MQVKTGFVSSQHSFTDASSCYCTLLRPFSYLCVRYNSLPATVLFLTCHPEGRGICGLNY